MWHDLYNRFRVFDKGTFKQLEDLKVEKYALGFDWVAYITNAGNFRVYRNGQISDITEGAFITSISENASLLSFTLGKQLDVISGKRNQTLSTWAEFVVTSDSLVFYKDGMQTQYYVYYKGDTYTLDDVSAIDRDFEKRFSLGKNTLAYVNSSNRLKVLYHGEFYGLSDYSPMLKFVAGQNIVAYTDRDGINFKAFWQGNVYDIDINAPLEMMAGNDMITYINMNEELMTFYNGKNYKVDGFRPKTYQCTDSLIIFTTTNNYTKVWYNGKTYTLDNIIPQKITASQSKVSWTDRNGWLMLFDAGKIIEVTKEQVTNPELQGNVLIYTLGRNDTKVFWNGKVY
ncbi:MAG: hypothetical protein IPO27_15905 [Bacteroidetes bacterium]|nr:hypothetical protein [Bacteroidota bacterium]